MKFKFAVSLSSSFSGVSSVENFATFNAARAFVASVAETEEIFWFVISGIDGKPIVSKL